MSNYILAIDQGTTSSRAILFDLAGKVIASEQQEFAQLYPANGWVEHKPEDILNSVLNTCTNLFNNHHIQAGTIKTLGITNQRETTLVWNRATGEPIYNAIVWQDRRTATTCQALKDAGYGEMITDKTGLLLDPYFSATKIKWILDNVEGARVKAEQGELAFGTVDTYLLWQLTKGSSHFTDASNASRTMLFNIKAQCWDEELLALFDIPKLILPTVLDSAADFGTTCADVFHFDIPIQGIAGDQQAALFGQTCFEKGSAKSTYGTGCFMMVNTGDLLVRSNNNLLATVGYRLNGKVTYAFEGSIFIAGAVVQWLRDQLKIIACAPESELYASQADLEHGVYFVPAFTGLGAPYWDPNARGALHGLTRASGINEICSAALQSVAFQTQDLITAMNSDGIKISTLRVDGGMVANNWFIQFLADSLNLPVDRPLTIETTALGAAYLAGLQAGLYQSLDDIKSQWQLCTEFSPQMPKLQRDRLYKGWQEAISRTLSKSP